MKQIETIDGKRYLILGFEFFNFNRREETYSDIVRNAMGIKLNAAYLTTVDKIIAYILYSSQQFIVAEINTEIEETIVEPVNALLFGIVSAFGVDAYAYTEETEDGNIKVVLDENSQFEDEDVNPQRKKYQDFDYDWDMEPRRSWEDINPDFDFWELFADAHIAGFQIMGIEFFDSVEKIEKCFNQMHVSQQLSVDERRMLANICMALRALGGTIEDHEDMLIIDTEAHFENVYVEEYGKFEKEGIPMGAYQVVYKDGDYEENLTEVITIPVAMKKNLLDVVHVNREYYFKLTGYLGEVFNLVKEWRVLSSIDEQEGVE